MSLLRGERSHLQSPLQSPPRKPLLSPVRGPLVSPLVSPLRSPLLSPMAERAEARWREGGSPVGERGERGVARSLSRERTIWSTMRSVPRLNPYPDNLNHEPCELRSER